MGNSTSVSLYIEECKRLKIEILPPDINESFAKFTVSEGKIRFGLTAIKNVGISAIESITECRERDGVYTSFTDFCRRVSANALNKRMVESLIKAGAFDSMLVKRSQLLSVYERIIDGITKDKKKNVEGQFSIFDTSEESTSDSQIESYPNIAEFDERTLLFMEKEITGIYITGHPLSAYEEDLKKITNANTIDILEANNNQEINLDNKLRDGSPITIGGIIAKKKNIITKKNSMMCFATLEDLYGNIELIVFPKPYEKYNRYLVEDEVILVSGRLVLNEEEEPKIICDKIQSMDDVGDLDSKFYIKIPKSKPDELLSDIKVILNRHKGDVPVYVYIERKEKMVMAQREYWVNIESEGLYREIESILGEDCVVLK